MHICVVCIHVSKIGMPETNPNLHISLGGRGWGIWIVLHTKASEKGITCRENTQVKFSDHSRDWSKQGGKGMKKWQAQGTKQLDPGGLASRWRSNSALPTLHIWYIYSWLGRAGYWIEWTRRSSLQAINMQGGELQWTFSVHTVSIGTWTRGGFGSWPGHAHVNNAHALRTWLVPYNGTFEGSQNVHP